jgi:single-strand DNA-binding protein
MDASIHLVGNITRDPELRFGDTGTPYARFGIAVTRRDKNKQETTSFYDVVSFGTLAENIAQSVGKGTRVHVSGRIEVRDFDRQDGTKGRAVEVVADEVSPSLRFATVSVTRNERTQQPAMAGGSYGGDPF